MSESVTSERNPEDPKGQTSGGAQHTQYHAYLLRLWRSGAHTAWRGSLQSVQSGERHMFTDLDSLLAFLCMELHLFPDP